MLSQVKIGVWKRWNSKTPKGYRWGIYCKEQTLTKTDCFWHIFWRRYSYFNCFKKLWESTLKRLILDSNDEKFKMLTAKQSKAMNDHDAWLAETNAKTI